MMHFFLKNLVKNQPHTTRGFTLVETLVAVAIIMVAILGPFALIKNNINAAYITRDQIIANSLAQEGIEYLRFYRDTNYLYTRNNASTPRVMFWGIDGTTGSTYNCVSNSCTVDPTLSQGATAPTTPFSQCSGTCPVLYVRPSNYTYTQQSAGNTATRFTRSFTLCYIQPSSSTCNGTLSNEAKVSVTVNWSTFGKSYSIVQTDYLQNWLQ